MPGLLYRAHEYSRAGLEFFLGSAGYGDVDGYGFLEGDDGLRAGQKLATLYVPGQKHTRV